MPTLKRTECPLFPLVKNFLLQTKKATAERQMELCRIVAENPKYSPPWLQARAELAAAYFPAVVRLAGKWSRDDDEREDAIQYGCIGLLRAIERFDLGRDIKFVTYAYHCIGREIRNCLDMDRGVSPSRRSAEIVRECHRAEGRFYAVFGRFPTDEELSEMTGISVRSIRESRRNLRAWSTDSAESKSHLDSLGYTESEADTYRPDDDDALFRAIAQLRERDRQVINRRFGLDGDAETLETIGDSLGITKERVRQLESRALGELRHLMKAV